MCGITGWISFGSDLRKHGELMNRMTDTMACRGPDARGVWLREHAALGHRRLAVIDLQGGVQPMVAETAGGPVATCYSGEVFNFVELRRALIERGHEFRTSSDTEVVLNGYLEWGEGVAERLNGMYAFVIWDERQRRLIMIRDRLGVKPLYYFPTEDGLIFGSEPKAILTNPLACRSVGLEGLRFLLAPMRAPGHTLWRGMIEVEPGSTVTADPGGVRTRRYWNLETTEHDDDRMSTVRRVRSLLADAVSRQLIADVPRCVLLSGGLDSSTITALAASSLVATSERLQTFSVEFAGDDHHFVPAKGRETADTAFVRAMVGHVGSAHENVVLDARGLTDPEIRRRAVAARDAPSDWGDLDVSLYLLFKAIRDKSTVALSGEAADELFGGYPWFWDEAAKPSGTFPWMATSGPRPHPWLRADVREVIDLETFVADQYSAAVADVTHVAGAARTERHMRSVSYLHLTRGVRNLLDRKDRMSMAVGLEVRVPYCDHRLVEYVYNAPWSMKVFDGREKSLLRAAVEELLPRSVAQRRKSFYPTVQDPRYVDVLQTQAKDLLAEPGNAMFDLADREWLKGAACADASAVTAETRAGLNMVLDLYHWLDLYRPRLMVGAGS